MKTLPYIILILFLSFTPLFVHSQVPQTGEVVQKLNSPTAAKAQPKAAAKSQTPKTAPAPVINMASREMNEQGSKAMQAKDFAKAEEIFKKALAIDSKNIAAVFNLAGAYLMNKKNQDAIQLLSSYISEYPSDPGLYSRLGEAYFSGKDLPNAEINFKKCLELHPQYPGTAMKLATVYSLQQKFSEAEGTFLLAIDQDPRNGDLLANLAGVFLANGKAQEAVNTAKRALQVKPSSDVYVTMGMAYERLRDDVNALISLQRALDLGDTRPGLKEKIEAMKAKQEQSETAAAK